VYDESKKDKKYIFAANCKLTINMKFMEHLQFGAQTYLSVSPHPLAR
jgi:hypothetical protein